MAPRPRCPECHRLTIPGDVNGTLPSLEPVKPHLVTLLRYARAFDDETPSDERYDAVAFVDFLALEAQTGMHVERAGKPGQIGKPKKAA